MNKTQATQEHQAPALRPYDILCGRSKHCFNNIGNRRFRITISMNLKKYESITKRNDRGKFIASLANTLKHEAGFRFLRILKNGEQVELTEEEVRAKIGHALRDLSTSLREGAAKSTNDTMRKEEAIKAMIMNSRNLEARSMRPKVVTPTLTKEKILGDASASQRYNFVAESMMPSLDDSINSNNSSNNNRVQEKVWNLPSMVSTVSFVPQREQDLEGPCFFPVDARGCNAAAHDDDSFLSHPQQQELEEETRTVSIFLPASIGKRVRLRVVSMPPNGSGAMEANAHLNSNTPFFHDSRTNHSSFFSSTNQQDNNTATCSMSLDDQDEDIDEEDDFFLGSRKLSHHSVDDLSLMDTSYHP
eukprot:scaffold4140_cov81-Cylindrotheca_fusiformis.AAC.4